MRTASAVVLMLGLLLSPVAAQQTSFTYLEPAVLLECKTSGAYFRTTVNAVDAQGQPVPVSLAPDSKDDHSRGFKVFEAGRAEPHRVLLVSPRASGAGSKGNYVMILLDVSGSMDAQLRGRTTRLLAATDAIKQSLRTFEAGVDHIAVAPFESHDVVPTIRATTFESTRDAASRQVDAVAAAALKKPANSRNTALYSAIVTALPLLVAKRNEDYGVALVVFSDGENQIKPGDDRDLLEGPAGLQTTLQQIAESRVPVITVGFGVLDGSLIARELQRMAFPNADNYHNAQTDPARLTRILEILRARQANQYQLLFGSVRDRMSQLSGADPAFRVVLTASGQTVSSKDDTWHAGTIGEVVPQSKCTTAEADAIVGGGPPPPPPGWQRVYIFFIFAAVLAALWFAAPRFAWPEAYIPRPVIPQLPTTNIPGAQLQQPAQPQMPTWDRLRGSGSPPAGPSSSRGGSGAPMPTGRDLPTDQTVVISSRPATRPPTGSDRTPAPPRRTPPPERGDDDDRQSGDETIFMPPPKNPKR